MFKFDYSTKEDIKKNNASRPQIPDHPCRILIVGHNGSGKDDLDDLDHLISHLPDFDKIYLYANDPYVSKIPIVN